MEQLLCLAPMCQQMRSTQETTSSSRRSRLRITPPVGITVNCESTCRSLPTVQIFTPRVLTQVSLPAESFCLLTSERCRILRSILFQKLWSSHGAPCQHSTLPEKCFDVLRVSRPSDSVLTPLDSTSQVLNFMSFISVRSKHFAVAFVSQRLAAEVGSQTSLLDATHRKSLTWVSAG